MSWRFNLFIGTMLFLMAAFSVAPWEDTLCRSDFVKKAISDPSKDGVLNCFEFWLNRYQTLFGALTAIGAAVAAWIAVQKQIAINRRQIAIAIGDIDPDIWMQAEQIQMYNCISQVSITIYNNNRLPFQINGIELVQPADAVMQIAYIGRSNTVAPVHHGKKSRNIRFVMRVHGTRPAAPEVNKMQFLVDLSIAGRDPVSGSRNWSDVAVVRLEYAMLGPGSQARKVDLRCAVIRTD